MSAGKSTYAHVRVEKMPLAWIERLRNHRQRGDGAERRELSFAPGQRNEYLTRLAGRLRAQGLEREEIEAQLLDCNDKQPEHLRLPRQEVRQIAKSISQYPAGHGPSLTDAGNAERLVRLLAGSAYHVPERRRWLLWTGRCWRWDDDGAIMRAAKRMAREIYAEAAATEDDHQRAALAKWARTSESAPRLKAAVELAQCELPLHLCELDRDPWLLGVANGVVDLRTGTLREARREDFITKRAMVAYDPTARAPTWDAFLACILPDAEVRGYVQKGVGYSLTGVVHEHCLFLCHGSGANGKSTFREVLLALLGDYATSLPAEALMALERTAGGPSPDVARLFGVRLALASESEEGARLAEARVKHLTGGDTITARHLYCSPFDFKPMHKLWLATNHLPNVTGDDHAIWRRIKVVPFTVTIPPKEQDASLSEKLKAELPGILNWAIAGCLAWQRDGLKEPAAVRDVVAAYRAEQDTFGRWLAENAVLHPKAAEQLSILFTDYKEWAEAEGVAPLGRKRFARRLLDMGIRRDASNTGRILWHGIGLRGPF